MKKMVMQCGQCKTQTADYFFHHANVNMRTIVPLFSSPKNNSPQPVRSLHFYTALMQWHINCFAVYFPKNVSTHNSVNLQQVNEQLIVLCERINYPMFHLNAYIISFPL